MRELYVGGCGFWTPGFGNWRARASQTRDPALREPACDAVPPRLLRGTSLVTRIAVEVAAQAAREAGASLATVPTVFASELGEVQTAIALLTMIRAEGLPSPMRFKNSVHNAASGTASIAWENRAFSTSLCAGDDLVAMALVEAVALLDVDGGDVVVSLAEEDIPSPLPRHGEYLPVGFGFHLTTARRPGAVRLARLRREAPAAEPVASYVGNACASAFGLLDAVTQRRAGVVPLSRGGDTPWCIDVEVDG